LPIFKQPRVDDKPSANLEPLPEFLAPEDIGPVPAVAS